MERVKKNDLVQVLSGKDRNKTGLVLEMFPKTDTVLVKGVNEITKHQKPGRSRDGGGRRVQEAVIPLSRVMPVCTGCRKPCRVRTQVTAAGDRVRVCGRCSEIF